jgi:hypothetical protein
MEVERGMLCRGAAGAARRPCQEVIYLYCLFFCSLLFRGQFIFGRGLPRCEFRVLRFSLFLVGRFSGGF